MKKLLLLPMLLLSFTVFAQDEHPISKGNWTIGLNTTELFANYEDYCYRPNSEGYADSGYEFNFYNLNITLGYMVLNHFEIYAILTSGMDYGWETDVQSSTYSIDTEYTFLDFGAGMGTRLYLSRGATTNYFGAYYQYLYEIYSGKCHSEDSSIEFNTVYDDWNSFYYGKGFKLGVETGLIIKLFKNLGLDISLNGKFILINYSDDDRLISTGVKLKTGFILFI
jgi:hypothetical protein